MYYACAYVIAEYVVHVVLCTYKHALSHIRTYVCPSCGFATPFPSQRTLMVLNVSGNGLDTLTELKCLAELTVLLAANNELDSLEVGLSVYAYVRTYVICLRTCVICCRV